MTLDMSLLDLLIPRGSDFVLPEVAEITPVVFRSKALAALSLTPRGVSWLSFIRGAKIEH